ncbi:response regulator [Bradyrhizobium sp. dw_411]|uniref:response regulator n=1 Tax=Bradyrhizobium sp. dw_411 TaxID=2720082 RepID=UPI001BCB7DA9|nr:response regulator [Bradyrhizobium sp. dw_411]
MSSSSARPVIYVVDDDPGVLGSLRFLLETDGFDVETFRNGPALLNAAAAKEADCFVIDYKMPNIDGIDLASRLRSRDIAAPIILITGYPDDNIRAKAVVAGVYDVLLKPHIEESLVARIRGVLQEAGPVAHP